MKLLNYQKEIVEKRLVEFDEPIGGETRWIRLSKNGALESWKPYSKKDVAFQSLNGYADDGIQQELELSYRRNHNRASWGY